MEITVQRETGLGEVMIVKLVAPAELAGAYEAIDRRLAQHNAKVVEANQFIEMVKDPNYRYMFVAFLNQFLGLSSQALFQAETPEGFAQWMAAQTKQPTPPPVRRIK